MSEKIWIRRQYHVEQLGPFEDRAAAEAYVEEQTDKDPYWAYDSVGYFTYDSWVNFHKEPPVDA